MKRKYLSALLMGALTVASVSTMTSCKDYDDDINNVETIADANNALIKKLQEQTSALQTALTTAQSTADAAKTAAADAATAAKNAQTTGDDALAKAKTAEAAAEAAKAAAAEAKEAAIADATKQVEELKKQVEAALSQKVDVAVFNDAVTKLEGTIAGIDETLNKLGNDVKKNQEEIKTAKQAIATLTAAQKDAANQIAALEAYKKTLESETIPGLNEAIKANGVEINGVKKSVEDLKKATDEAQKKLSGEIAKVSGDLAALQATVNGIDEAYKKADADLKEQIKALLETVNTNKDEATSAINLAVKDINELMASNKTELEKYAKDEAKAAAKAVKDDLQKQIDALSKITINGTEQGLAKWMTDINDKFDNYYTTGQIDKKITDLTKDYKKAVADAAKEASKALSDAVKEINRDLGGKIQTLHILVAKRLTSIVFAPTTYINGIEAIKFATLQYYDWGTKAADWEADQAKMDAHGYTGTKVWTYINDKETIVNYLLNPTGVTLDDIASLEFVSQEATNTRAAGAPIQVADKKVVDGKLILNVQKVGNAPLGNSLSKFPIVALKAKLADKVLAENEQNVFVYSDWARLYESTERPFIHNVKAKNEDGTPSESLYGSHFWNYSTVYDGGTKDKELSDVYNTQHIAAEVNYNKSVDLNKLVEVCDKNGSIYDLDKFGLKFEFHLMDYKLKNELETVDATNQIHFGKLLEDGHTLVATSRDGKVGNRDAIGRQPMIQAVLKDVNDPKNVKVIDVRYFKIKWIDEIVAKEYGALTKDFTENYSCGNTYDFIVKEEAVNKVYASENMSRDEFHSVYYPDSHLYPTVKDATNGTNQLANTNFSDLQDWLSAGQTHNMKWTYDVTNFKATQAEYEAGKAVRTVYGVFYKNSNRNSKIIFSLTAVLKINKMAYADGLNYSQEQWAPAGLTMANGLSNASKARTINPALRSDATYGTAHFTDAQIIGDLKAGYINNGQVPANVAALVKNSENVNLIFDKARLSEVASATNTNTADWTVVNNGYELKYKNVAAAEISANGVISLKEVNPGHEGKPTAGALLLVGKKVPVILNTDYCGLNETIDKYLVNFMQPLTMNDIKITDNLVDIIDGGSVSVSIKDKIIIKEAFGLKRTILGPANQLHAEAAALRTWYIVKAPFWDQANIKTNLQKNGTIGSSVNQKLSELKNADGSAKYRVVVDGTAQTVTFHNMSGNAISQPFQISIPVSVKTKWGTFTQNVIINVKPGN